MAWGQTTGRRPPEQQPEQTSPPDSPVPLDNARRPFEALFGGTGSQPPQGHAVTFNGSVQEVYDRDQVEEGEPQLGGLYTLFTGNVDLKRYGSRTQLAAAAGVNLRYYTQVSDFLASDYQGSFGVETRVTDQTTVRADQVVGYSLVALPGLFATPLPPELGGLPPGSIYAVSKDRFITSATTGAVEHGFSVRSQLIARGSVRYSHYFAEDTPTSDWSTLDAGAAYRYRLTETRSLRAGYNYRRASYSLEFAPNGQGPQPDEHNLFVGVAVERAYSDENRTMLRFEGGPSIFSATAPAGLLNEQSRMRFVYNAAVAQQFGTTWLLVGSSSRGSQFDQGYGGPVFADALTGSLTGFFNTRADLTASFAYTNGESLLAIGGREFSMTNGGARFRYALSRNWALTAEYFRYAYDFTNAPAFPELIGVDEKFTRNSIRGGVLVFLPISPR